MSDGNKRQGPRTEVVVAIIGLISVVSVALIENWDNIFEASPPDSPEAIATPNSTPSLTPTPSLTQTSSPTPVAEVSSNHSSSPESSSPELSSAESASCVITIRHPLVSLKSEPDRFSRDISGVAPGDYTPIDHKIVSTPVSEDGWFQIEVDGRQGWIVNDTWTIDDKTASCP